MTNNRVATMGTREEIRRVGRVLLPCGLLLSPSFWLDDPCRLDAADAPQWIARRCQMQLRPEHVNEKQRLCLLYSEARFQLSHNSP